MHGNAAAGGEKQHKRVTAPVGDEKSACGAKRGEDQSFGEKLLQETAAGSSDGDADGHLVASGEGTDEEQVADVGAGDQQNKNNNDEHYFERREQSAGVVERRLP
jgi:hypothetical protein